MREFVSANERHPESGRAVPGLRSGFGDSVSGESVESAESAESGENSPNGWFRMRQNPFQPPPNELKLDPKRDA